MPNIGTSPSALSRRATQLRPLVLELITLDPTDVLIVQLSNIQPGSFYLSWIEFWRHATDPYTNPLLTEFPPEELQTLITKRKLRQHIPSKLVYFANVAYSTDPKHYLISYDSRKGEVTPRKQVSKDFCYVKSQHSVPQNIRKIDVIRDQNRVCVFPYDDTVFMACAVLKNRQMTDDIIRFSSAPPAERLQAMTSHLPNIGIVQEDNAIVVLI